MQVRIDPKTQQVKVTATKTELAKINAAIDVLSGLAHVAMFKEPAQTAITHLGVVASILRGEVEEPKE